MSHDTMRVACVLTPVRHGCVLPRRPQTGNSHMALLMAPSGCDVEELRRTRGRLCSRDTDSTADPTAHSTAAAVNSSGQLLRFSSGALLTTPEEEQVVWRSGERQQPGSSGGSSSSSMTRGKQQREKRVSWKNSFTSFTKGHSRSNSLVDEAEQQLQGMGCQQQQEQQADQTYVALDVIHAPQADVFGGVSSNGSTSKAGNGAVIALTTATGAATHGSAQQQQEQQFRAKSTAATSP
ncbi:hypothetical protein COO60DRAFT_384819 [Scenedesmus sp. NREL 46B-D3]|nr:hypothetical protein COO60DRAFT_384819 [Scenedesmus sp. NREL 46B-D3]